MTIAKTTTTSKTYTLDAQRAEMDAELNLSWTKAKLRLSEWLLQSTEDLAPSSDIREIKCIVDSVCGLEKLIGPAAVVKDASDLTRTNDHSERLAARFDKMQKPCIKSASKRKAQTPPSE